MARLIGAAIFTYLEELLITRFPYYYMLDFRRHHAGGYPLSCPVYSSWYFLRYLSPRNEDMVFEDAQVKKWMPVDQYIGGIEHGTVHLIYCRYFTQVLNDMGLVDFDEPAVKLFCQGDGCKEAHYCEKDKWLWAYEVKDGKCVKCGAPVRTDIYKISKTKLNIVDPDAIMYKMGADTIRLYILSDALPQGPDME